MLFVSDSAILEVGECFEMNSSIAPDKGAEDKELERVKELSELGARSVYNMSLAQIAKVLNSAGKTLDQSEFDVLVLAGLSAEKAAS